jgi:hypothetical protein
MAVWNGQDLDKGAPTLGFTLATALLVPDFVRQALSQEGLFENVQDTQLTPLDDLKDWMRSDPWRSGDLFSRASDLLLAEERQARAAAKKAGVEFDEVGFELEAMEEDPGFESFDPEWAADLLRLAVEEADSVQAWCRRTHGVDFALAASFQLPDPRRHRVFRREDIGAALAAHATPALAQAVATGRAARLELAGAFQLDLSAPGAGPSFGRANGVGFVRIPCADPRCGDETVAHLSLAYPLDSEGYFLMTFDALRRALTLKEFGDE